MNLFMNIHLSGMSLHNHRIMTHTSAQQWPLTPHTQLAVLVPYSTLERSLSAMHAFKQAISQGAYMKRADPEQSQMLLLNNSQFAIIVTDANDCVLLFNQTAQRFTGVAASQIRGKTLASVFPNLSTSTLIKSDQLQTDSYRLVEGSNDAVCSGKNHC